jgi:hypothetical protein
LYAAGAGSRTNFRARERYYASDFFRYVTLTRPQLAAHAKSITVEGYDNRETGYEEDGEPSIKLLETIHSDDDCGMAKDGVDFCTVPAAALQTLECQYVNSPR